MILLISNCIITGLSIALLCISKKIDKRFRTVINEKKNTPRVETLQVFISKPMDCYSNNITISTFNSFNREKIADYFTRKLIDDNIIKIKDRGDFYEATITIVKE